MSSTVKRAGGLDEALALQQEALELKRKVLGPEHLNTLNSMMLVRQLLKLQGRLDEAETLARETLARCERSLGPKHSLTTASQLHLAGYLQDRAPAAALDLLESAVRNGLEPSLRREVSVELFPALRGNGRFEALVAEVQKAQPARSP